MKIWVDFINTPQVNFFEGLIEKLNFKGVDYIITCRDSANTIKLIEQKKWDYNLVDGYKKGNTILKSIGFPLRLFRLWKFIRKQKIDAAICQSSFYLPVVSWSLKIPSIYTNDNEHAKGNFFGFVFATKVILPEVLNKFISNSRYKGHEKISYYPGIKEGIYLNSIRDDIKNTKEKKEKKCIYFRPEPLTAQYYRGPKYFMDSLLIELAKNYQVKIIPRCIQQFKHYSKEDFKECIIQDGVIKLTDLVSDCDLFIGAGGSMTRELSLLGVKVISTYQGKLLESDRFLINHGLLVHNSNPNVSFVVNIIENDQIDHKTKVIDSILDKGVEANQLIIKQLLSLK